MAQIALFVNRDPSTASAFGRRLIELGDQDLQDRTFSKAYALAGLRISYGLGHPDMMKEIARFGCGLTSTNMAGFGAAARPRQEITRLCALDAPVLRKRARKDGAHDGRRTATFMLIELGARASEIREALVRQKIFIRYGAEWDLPEHVRISYGLEAENQPFLRALAKLVPWNRSSSHKSRALLRAGFVAPPPNI